MRTIRTLVAVAALSIIAAACGDDDAATTTTQPDGTSGTVATTNGGSGIGTENGSVTFVISGDYEASGEFPFIPAASAPTGVGGWSASFSEGGDVIITMNTIPGSLSVTYGDSEVVIVGIESTCTFELSKNDDSGFTGSFECAGPIGFRSQTGAPITVNFSGEFSGNP